MSYQNEDKRIKYNFPFFNRKKYGDIMDKKSKDNPIKENILEEANRITSTDRQKAYGLPRDNMEHIAKVFSALMGIPFSARDVVLFNLVQKLCRESKKHSHDSVVDIAGYAWVMSQVERDE